MPFKRPILIPIQYSILLTYLPIWTTKGTYGKGARQTSS